MKNICKDIQVVILAGGKGTRLEKINNGLPKSLTPVLSTPIIKHQIEFCKTQGFEKFLLILCYKSDQIIDYFNKNPIEDIEIEFFVEDKPMGTAGSLFSSIKLLKSHFLVLYGDTYITVDLKKFIKKFKNFKSDDKEILGQILIHPNNHPFDSDLVELNEKNILIGIHGYPHPDNVQYSNLVNAACYLFTKELIKIIIENIDRNCILDIAKDIFPIVIEKNIKILGYQTVEFIKDMGTPVRLSKLEKVLESGRLKNIGPNTPKKVIFIDRDGCINKEVGRIVNEEDLELIDGAAEGILNFNNASLPVFCVTNQPVIARGDINKKKLEKIHARLDFLLGNKGAFIDKLYYCPHHPDKGFAGELLKYKIKCDCRKPNIGMIFKAAQENGVNLGKSWFIGDSSTDIAAAEKCGIRSVLLKTGYGGSDMKEEVRPNYIFEDLFEASNWIVNDYKLLKESIFSNITKFLKGKLILISGLSRVGKSTYSQVLKEVLEDLGHDCYVISADSWLKNKSERDKGLNVFERYDMNEIENFIKNCLNDNFPIYHNHKISFQDNENIVDFSEIIHKNAYVILEGIPIVNFFKEYKDNILKIFLDTEEDKRRERFWKKYIKKNLTNDEIDKLFKLRFIDEDSLILKKRYFSDLEIMM